MSSLSLNDAAWASLFDKYDIPRNIERNGAFGISAAQIKEFREPRLMAKFDHTSNLPKLFVENELAILPVTRGDYVISHFDAYHAFEAADAPVRKVTLPAHVQSLDVSGLSSEALALNCAAASGIIADFMEDSEIVATVSGRMSSGAFGFVINDLRANRPRSVYVNNSQIEIDAAYEGLSYLAIFEAKRDLSEDFLVRQLYYPFRTWERRVKKRVKPIFLVYSNGIYSLYEYAFEDPNSYNSLRLVKQRNYSVEDTSISIEDIRGALEKAVTAEEPAGLPFPQANRFERIINLCELASEGELSRTDVTANYDFDERQTNYYTDAARYLGLLEKRSESGTPMYSLSEDGRRILGLDYKDRQLAYCDRILRHKVFGDSLRLYFKKGELPNAEEIAGIMGGLELGGVESESTRLRRASTVKRWLGWMLSLVNK